MSTRRLNVTPSCGWPRLVALYVSQCAGACFCARSQRLLCCFFYQQGRSRLPRPDGNRVYRPNDKGLPNHGGRTGNNVQTGKYLGDTVRLEERRPQLTLAGQEEESLGFAFVTELANISRSSHSRTC